MKFIHNCAIRWDACYPPMAIRAKGVVEPFEDNNSARERYLTEEEVVQLLVLRGIRIH